MGLAGIRRQAGTVIHSENAGDMSNRAINGGNREGLTEGGSLRRDQLLDMIPG